MDSTGMCASVRGTRRSLRRKSEALHDYDVKEQVVSEVLIRTDVYTMASTGGASKEVAAAGLRCQVLGT